MTNKKVKHPRKNPKHKPYQTYAVFVKVMGLIGEFKINVWANSKTQARQKAMKTMVCFFIEPDPTAQTFYNLLPIHDTTYFNQHPYEFRN